MKILAVCSVINFRDFTRRATIEAIKKETENLDLLFYTSLKNRFKRKITVKGIPYSTYHFWIPDKFKKFRIPRFIEHFLRSFSWKRKISKYDLVFFTDPNQAWLIPYLKDTRIIIYLLRDPNVLQDIKNKTTEKLLLDKCNLVLATSKNLTNLYLQKYHGISHKTVHFWPNCVDLNIWDYRKFIKNNNSKLPKIGVAGNFSKNRTDYELLDYVTSELQDLDFEIAGSIDYEQSRYFWDNLFRKKNVHYLGFIPFDLLPETVANWNVGLITDKIEEYASYMHHNKVYQYLALGIPVVSLKIHEDYNELFPYVILADDYIHYAWNIRIALKQSINESFRNACIEIACLNSSEVRAKDFLSRINNI
jgi:hypothetical protein